MLLRLPGEANINQEKVKSPWKVRRENNRVNRRQAFPCERDKHGVCLAGTCPTEEGGLHYVRMSSLLPKTVGLFTVSLQWSV